MRYNTPTAGGWLEESLIPESIFANIPYDDHTKMLEHLNVGIVGETELDTSAGVNRHYLIVQQLHYIKYTE